MAERPILVRGSGREKSSPAGSPAPNMTTGTRKYTDELSQQNAGSLLRRSSSTKQPTTDNKTKVTTTPVSDSKMPVKVVRADSSNKAKHLGYNSDTKPTGVSAKNLWRERLSSSSTGKKQPDERESTMDFPKWSRDDPRFKTSDSVSTATNLKGSMVISPPEAGDTMIDWSSVSPGVKNFNKKHQNLDSKLNGDRYQFSFNNHTSSKKKEGWNFAKSVAPGSSGYCLDADQDSNVKTRLFEDSKIGIQTTEELKGMITQQMGSLTAYQGRFDHLLSDTPRVVEQTDQRMKSKDSIGTKGNPKRKPNSSIVNSRLESKIFSKFDSPSLDSFDRIESNKSQLQSILNGRRSYTGQSTTKEMRTFDSQRRQVTPVESNRAGLQLISKSNLPDSSKQSTSNMRLRLAQSCANIKSNKNDDCAAGHHPEAETATRPVIGLTKSRKGSPKHATINKSSDIRKDRASVPQVRPDSQPSPLRLAAALARPNTMAGVTISASLTSELASSSKGAVMTVSPGRKPHSSRASNLTSFSGLGLRKSSASRVSYSTKSRDPKLGTKRQSSVDCVSPPKPQKFTHTYYMAGLQHHFRTDKPDYFTPVYKDHLQLSFNSVRFSKMLDSREVDEFIRTNLVDLPQEPKHKGMPTIVFDLDETLVHCEAAKTSGGEVLSVVLPNGRKIDVVSVYLDCHLYQAGSSPDSSPALQSG